MTFLLYVLNSGEHSIIVKAVIFLDKLYQSQHNVFDCFLLASLFTYSFLLNVLVLTHAFPYAPNPTMIVANESFVLVHYSHDYIE